MTDLSIKTYKRNKNKLSQFDYISLSKNNDSMNSTYRTTASGSLYLKKQLAKTASSKTRNQGSRPKSTKYSISKGELVVFEESQRSSNLGKSHKDNFIQFNRDGTRSMNTSVLNNSSDPLAMYKSWNSKTLI